jgi:hypothetical protein
MLAHVSTIDGLVSSGKGKVARASAQAASLQYVGENVVLNGAHATSEIRSGSLKSRSALGLVAGLFGGELPFPASALIDSALNWIAA